MCRFTNCHTRRRAEPARAANIRDVSDATPISIFEEQAPRRAWTFNRKAFAVTLAVVLGIPSLILLLFSALFVIVLLTSVAEQRVAGEMTLTNEWVEITPDRPLRPLKQYQVIVLDGAEPTTEQSDWYDRAVRPDVYEPHPEVVLVNERGEAVRVELRRASMPAGYGNAIGGYAPDGVYVRVRVRSNRPLRVRRIMWHCWDGK